MSDFNVREGMNGPTIYARLMDLATDQPVHELTEELARQFRPLESSLADEFAEQLRRAYRAGVTDGFRQGLEQLSPEDDSYEQRCSDPEGLSLLSEHERDCPVHGDSSLSPEDS
jgi:hypothetical protein